MNINKSSYTKNLIRKTNCINHQAKKLNKMTYKKTFQEKQCLIEIRIYYNLNDNKKGTFL